MYFNFDFVGKPTPSFSADNGIGAIHDRHVDVAAGTVRLGGMRASIL